MITKWNKVSEQKPTVSQFNVFETSDRLIIYCKNGEYLLGRYYKGGDGEYFENDEGGVVHGVEQWTYMPGIDRA